MAMVVIAWMIRIYRRIIRVVRGVRMIWVIAAPAPVRIPCIAPVIWVIAVIRSPIWIPKRIPTIIIGVRPIAESEARSNLNRDICVWGFFYHINSIDNAVNAIGLGRFLVNLACLFGAFTLFRLHSVRVEIAVI